MAKKRVHLMIHGRVQGVFFRSNTQKQAKRLDLTGFVKNREDGAVEIIAEGEEKNLQELIIWCNNGPITAKVDHIETGWSEFKGEFNSFSIHY